MPARACGSSSCVATQLARAEASVGSLDTRLAIDLNQVFGVRDAGATRSKAAANKT